MTLDSKTKAQITKSVERPKPLLPHFIQVYLLAISAMAALYFSEYNGLSVLLGILQGLVIILILRASAFVRHIDDNKAIPDELVMIPGVKEWLRQIPYRLILQSLLGLCVLFALSGILFVYVRRDKLPLPEFFETAFYFFLGVLPTILIYAILLRKKQLRSLKQD